jgi:hypothetical protein
MMTPMELKKIELKIELKIKQCQISKGKKNFLDIIISNYFQKKKMTTRIKAYLATYETNKFSI